MWEKSCYNKTKELRVKFFNDSCERDIKTNHDQILCNLNICSVKKFYISLNK